MAILLGRWIRDERVALKLSQEELGRQSGVPQQTISMIERGVARMDVGIAQSVRKLAEALGVSGLEAFHKAGLLDFADADDQESVRILMLLRGLTSEQRAKVVDVIENIGKEK